MKVGIVGSRAFPRLNLVRAYVQSLAPGTVVISGGARGVDEMARDAADFYGFVSVEYRADWEGLGRGAGMARNTLIVEQSDIVVAFWDGASRGTRDTMKKAHAVDKLKRVVVCRHGGLPEVYETPGVITAVIGA